jgi:uncharacterized membrane protein YhaH (DUF805 family)
MENTRRPYLVWVGFLLIILGPVLFILIGSWADETFGDPTMGLFGAPFWFLFLLVLLPVVSIIKGISLVFRGLGRSLAAKKSGGEVSGSLIAVLLSGAVLVLWLVYSQ